MLNLLFVLLLAGAPVRGEIVTSAVVPSAEGVTVIAGWAEVSVPLEMSVYSAPSPDGSFLRYEGEAICPASFCVFFDSTPDAVYWFEEEGRLYGPVVAEAWQVPVRLFERESEGGK